MRAMVLAAGLGTRLRPLTHIRPKCLMPIMNQPLLGLWLSRLAGLRVSRAVVNTHHLATQVRQYLAGGTWPGLEVAVSHEPVILGTGGGLVQARPWLGEKPFLLVNADVAPGAELAPLGQEMAAADCLAVLGLVDEPRFNTVALDAQGRVLGFRGDPGLDRAAAWLTYSGLAVLSPRLLDYLPASGECSLVQGLQAALAAGEIVLGHRLGGFWDDLGTPERLIALHRSLFGQAPAGLERLAQAGPVLLGPGATLEPGARVEGFAVLGEGARIESGARVKDSLLLPGARVVGGAIVDEAVLGDGFVASGHIRGGAHA